MDLSSKSNDVVHIRKKHFSSFLIQQIKARKKSILELDDGDLIDESNLIDEEEEERQRPVYPPGEVNYFSCLMAYCRK